MEKDTTQNQENEGSEPKDIQVYEAVSNFIKDKEGIQVYRRSEKICKAYFLLTQHIQDNDSIKQRLRTLALDMSSRTLDLVINFNKTDEMARSVATNAISLVGLSDIAVSARLISSTNYTLMVRQVQIFIEEVDIYCKTLSDNNQVIPVHMFDVEALDTSYKNSSMSFMNTEKEYSNHSQQTHHTHKAPANASSNKHHSVAPKNNQDVLKSTKVSSSISSPAKTEPRSAGGNQSKDNKNERQTLILNAISARGESSIKDLTDVIKGCSEKTIQRELIALVSAGNLLKTGERRWSRYSIVR